MHMPVQGHIWATIIMYLIGAVVLAVVTHLWLTYRLKKKQRDDQNLAAKQNNQRNLR